MTKKVEYEFFWQTEIVINDKRIYSHFKLKLKTHKGTLHYNIWSSATDSSRLRLCPLCYRLMQHPSYNVLRKDCNFSIEDLPQDISCIKTIAFVHGKYLNVAMPLALGNTQSREWHGIDDKCVEQWIMNESSFKFFLILYISTNIHYFFLLNCKYFKLIQKLPNWFKSSLFNT